MARIQVGMGGFEYSFGTGAAEPTLWSSSADLDLGPPGALDSISLDFDGDGRADDAMWDSDADGVADRSVLDLDDDGTLDAYFADPSGTGVWNQQVPGPGSVLPDMHSAVPGVDDVLDTDGDGRFDTLVLPDATVTDTDRDGYLDAVEFT